MFKIIALNSVFAARNFNQTQLDTPVVISGKHIPYRSKRICRNADGSFVTPFDCGQVSNVIDELILSFFADKPGRAHKGNLDV